MPCHSKGWEVSSACSAVHLNDIYGLLMHVPHLVDMLRVRSTSDGYSSPASGTFDSCKKSIVDSVVKIIFRSS
jgi:hypothetical protein